MTEAADRDVLDQVELPDDPTTVPFWQAALRGTLTVQLCASCDAHQFFPRPVCVTCGSTEVSWVPVSGQAHVYSVTTVHMRVADDLDPPYDVALVDLIEGVRMLALTGDGAGLLAPGERVQVELAQRPGMLPRLVAHPAGRD